MNLIIAMLLIFSGAAKDGDHPSLFTPEELLQRTSATLNNCSSLYYLHERDYFTGNAHYITTGYNYIDFNSSDGIINLRYQITAGDQSYIYNGSENITLNKKEKTIEVKYHPGADDMEGGSFFYNSLVSLRRTLLDITTDKGIEKKNKRYPHQ